MSFLPSRRRARPRRPGAPLIPRRIRADPLVRAVVALDPDPLRAAFAVLLGVGALSCAIGLMATSAWLISRAAECPPVLYLQVAVVATRAFGIGRGVLRYGERLASHDVALRGVVTVRENLYRGLAAAEPSTVAALRRGDLLARVGADVDTLADLVVRSLLPFAVATVTTAGSALLILTILPSAGLAVAFCLLLAAVFAPWLALVSARRSQRAADTARDRTVREVMSLLDDLPELTVCGGCTERLDHLRQLDDERFREVDRAAAPAAPAGALNVLLTGLAVLAALVLGIGAVREGVLAPVLLAVVTLTPLAAAEAISGLPAAATGLVRCRAAAERLLPLLQAPAAAAAPTDSSPPPLPADGPGETGQRGATDSAAGSVPDRGPALGHGPAGDLTAVGMSCGWPGGRTVIEGIDLALRPGSRIAVVGPSGGGKTTLLLTLAGLLPARAGRVALDSVPLSDVDPHLLRRTVNLTAEDAHVFHTTVRENLRVAAPEGTPDENLLAALGRTGLGTWIDGLADGLDTVLGPGGTGLSGGERRRLLLARALLVGARVLLLDEPGEHLDPDTADRLLRDVFGSARTRAEETFERDRAVLVVTHRVTPLEVADEVLVLEGSRVAARGTHAWLVENHPPYRDLLLAERFVTCRTRTTARGSAR
jgi:ATP-binding cassette, subfamily C, bacterial CydC